MLDIIPYEVMKLLGWATVILVSLAVTFHLLLLLNKRISKSKSDSTTVKKLKKLLKKTIPLIRSYHGTFGFMALLTGISHGYLLLRSFKLHTGYLTWGFIIVMGITGASTKLNRGKKPYKLLKKIHTAIMYVTVVVMITHIILMQ